MPVFGAKLGRGSLPQKQLVVLRQFLSASWVPNKIGRSTKSSSICFSGATQSLGNLVQFRSHGYGYQLVRIVFGAPVLSSPNSILKFMGNLRLHKTRSERVESALILAFGQKAQGGSPAQCPRAGYYPSGAKDASAPNSAPSAASEVSEGCQRAPVTKK